MSEAVDVMTWLYGKLSGITGVSGRVYSDIAPIGSTWPCIVFSQTDPVGDVNSMNGLRILNTSLWLVRVIGQVNGFKALETIYNAIDAAIHKQASGNVQSCIREQEFTLTETIDGVQYRHLGGIYRIMT